VIKTVIIRLEENEHSCQMAQECYDQAVKFNLQPEFFKAVNGHNADYHYEHTGIVKAGKFKKNRLGVAGCFFSHYYIWEKCIKLNEPIIVLEHDGYFIRPLPDNILDQFTDVLKLDKLDPYSSKYNSLIETGQNTIITVEDYKNPAPKDLSKHGISNYFKGAYSYIIKPSGARKLIHNIKNYGHRPADQQINDTILNLKTTVPTVARLHPFYAIGSNIGTASLTRNL
jgi:glycosyl transferase family 25